MIEMQLKNVGPGKWYICVGLRWQYVTYSLDPIEIRWALNAAMAKLAAELRRGAREGST